MNNHSTIDSLLSSSQEDDLAPLPMSTHIRFLKRISKEQIKGWNTSTHTESVKPKAIIRTHKKININTHKSPEKIEKTKTYQHYQQSNLISIKQHQEKNQSAPDFSLFKVFDHFPTINDKMTSSLVNQEDQDLLDYIKGKKIQCPPLPKKQSLPKTLFSTFEDKKPPVKSFRSCSLQQELDSPPRITRKRINPEKQKQNSVSIISYPIESLNIYHRPDLSARAKLTNYMKKYEI